MLEQPIDWGDLEAAGRATRTVLRRLGEDDGRLTAFFESEPLPELLAASEEDDGRCFLALAVGAGTLGVELIPAGDRQGPHDHPYSYSALILQGGYQHTWLRGHDDQRPFLTRFEQPGSCYTLDRSVVHRTVAHADTVVLSVRGARARTTHAGLEPGRYEQLRANTLTTIRSILRGS